MKGIRQRDYKDCGVACLAYIIEFYHGFVPFEKLREDTYTDTSGCTAYHLVEALKKYGFDSYGQKVSLDDLKGVVKPAIVHLILRNGMHHFAVLCQVKKNGYILMDPAEGKRKVSKEEFSEIWDGIVLIAVPNQMIPKMPKEKSILYHLFAFFKKEKKALGFLVLFSFFLTFLSIINSFYFKIGMEKLVSFSSHNFLNFIGIFTILFLFQMIFEFLKIFLELHLEKNIEVRYLFSFLSHLMRLPLQKFQSYQEGEILTRIEEAKEIKNLVHEICITFLLEGMLGAFSVIILFWMNLKLSIVVMIGMILYLFGGIVTSKLFYTLVLKSMDVERKWNESLLDKLRSFGTMKHLNKTTYQLDRLEEDLCITIKEKSRLEATARFYQYMKNYFLKILFFLITTYGMLLISENELSLLDFITFQSLYAYFVNPLKELSDIGPKFYYLKGILSKLSETMAWPEEKINESVPNIPVDAISVHNLSISYHGLCQIFSDLSFDIKPSEHVFLEGPSGCGKSTFCKILHRDIEDYCGMITISSKNLRDYNLSEIRKSILYLSQKESLISGTIKENILFGSIESERFLEVAQVCEIESIVSKKILRYETTVYEGSLSGGEKQRILLARCLMKEGSLYIFDEALSEIEKNLEEKIIQKLRIFLKGKTIIYISHTNHEKLFERRIHFERTKYLE